MLVKKNKLNNAVRAFGESGAINAVKYLQKFRSFSVYNNSGACSIVVGPNTVAVPVGVTVTWDAPTEESVINRYDAGMFTVDAEDCIIVGTY